jgi:hypothetical protein
MTKQSKKNKKYLETKRAFKSKLSDEGKNMTDFLLKPIYKYVGKNITNN